MTDQSPHRRGPSTTQLYVGLLAAVAVLLFAVNMAMSSPSRTSAPEAAPTRTLTAVESALAEYRSEVERLEREGYTVTDGVGIRFLNDVEKQERSCSLGKCVWVKVVSIEGCRSVYVEANILEEDGTIVDWTNATGSRMSAGDEAILELSKYRTTGSQFRLSKVSCH